MAKPGQHILDALFSFNWYDLAQRLLLYAYLKFGDALKSCSYTPEDLVYEAIVDVFTGRRTWPRNVDPLTAFAMIIRSKASHIIEKEQRHVSISHFVDGIPGNDAVNPGPYRFEIENIITLFEDDTIIQKMLKLLQEDPLLEPRDLAEMLNLPVTKIYNAKRRIKYRMEKITSRMEREIVPLTSEGGQLDE